MEHTARWSVDVFLFEHETSTTARAVLSAGGSQEVTGEGSAHPVTPDRRMTEIVNEVAVGRALVDLGGRLAALAVGDTEALISAASGGAGSSAGSAQRPPAG